MAFSVQQKILFKHCDPAGIVFYPRIFEMVNDCVEAFFADALDLPFEELHKTGAVPTVATDAKFTAPSRHGDVLDINLVPLRIGRTSLSLEVAAVCGQETRFVSKPVLVHVNQDGKPEPWAASVIEKVSRMIEGKI